MNLFNKSLLHIISIYKGLILCYIHNNKKSEKNKEFSRYYYSYYLVIEYESLIDLESIDVLIKYIDLKNDKLIKEGILIK